MSGVKRPEVAGSGAPDSGPHRWSPQVSRSPNPASRHPRDLAVDTRRHLSCGSGRALGAGEGAREERQVRHSKRAYEYGAEDLIRWNQSRPGPPSLSKAVVHEYRTAFQRAKVAPSPINVRLAAIRRLASEGAHNQLLDLELPPASPRSRGRMKKCGMLPLQSMVENRCTRSGRLLRACRSGRGRAQ